MTAALGWRFVSAPTLLLVIAFLAMVMPSGARLSGAAGEALVQGDVTCDGTVNAVDSLQILRSVAGLGTSAGCVVDAGDVNCDEAVDSVDSLRILRYVAGLSNTSPDGCVTIGEPLAPEPPGDPITVTLSDFGSVSEEIGPGGGTLIATALDGTGYTLDVPEGALLGPELITMTPVDSIETLPIPGGLVAAVDLQPSGLVFWDAVILTIEPVAEVPAADQTAFVISQGEFVLHPLVLDSAEIQLPLTHFSAAGIGRGSVADVRRASSALDQYTAHAAELVLPQRSALLGGGAGDPEFNTKLAELMEDYYDANLAPELGVPGVSVAGLGACSVEIQVVGHALGFVAQGQRIGGQSFPQIQTALMRLSPYLAGCRQSDFDRCVQFHDLGAISRIVAYTRMMAILGIPDSPSPLEEMIQKCARFEIDFESWFCVDDLTDFCDTGIEYLFKTPSNDGIFSMPLTPINAPLVSLPLERHTGEWGPAQGCEGTMASPGSVFKVLDGRVSMNPFLGNRSPPVTLVINPGIPPEKLTLTCPWGTDIQDTTLWWQKWCSWHQSELAPPYADTAALCFYNEEPNGWGFAIRGWTWSGDQVIAKEYRRDQDDVGALEIGWEFSQIKLTHAPLP